MSLSIKIMYVQHVCSVCFAAALKKAPQFESCCLMTWEIVGNIKCFLISLLFHTFHTDFQVCLFSLYRRPRNTNFVLCVNTSYWNCFSFLFVSFMMISILSFTSSSADPDYLVGVSLWESGVRSLQQVEKINARSAIAGCVYHEHAAVLCRNMVFPSRFSPMCIDLIPHRQQ